MHKNMAALLLENRGSADGMYSCISHLPITSAPFPPDTATPSQFMLQ